MSKLPFIARESLVHSLSFCPTGGNRESEIPSWYCSRTDRRWDYLESWYRVLFPRYADHAPTLATILADVRRTDAQLRWHLSIVPMIRPSSIGFIRVLEPVVDADDAYDTDGGLDEHNNGWRPRTDRHVGQATQSRLDELQRFYAEAEAAGAETSFFAD